MSGLRYAENIGFTFYELIQNLWLIMYIMAILKCNIPIVKFEKYASHKTAQYQIIQYSVT